MFDLVEIDSSSRDELIQLGLSKEFVETQMSKWFANDPSESCFSIDSIEEIINFDWQKHLIGNGLLAIGFCPNGDPIAIKIDEPELPIVFISHEHEGLYGEGIPVWIYVSSSLNSFIEESNADEDYPWDYFEVKRRG